jgi:hypothetical protein
MNIQRFFISIFWLICQSALADFNGYQNGINMLDVSFVQDSNFAISGGKDQKLKAWDFKGHTGTITSVAVSKDNKSILSASSDKTIKQWKMCEFPTESLGKAIIIAAGGAQRSNTLFPYSNEYAQRMYNLVRQHSLTDSDGYEEYHLHDYTLRNVKADIEDAFLKAAKNLKPGQQFILYIHGHARKDHIKITPTDELSASKLKCLLDTLPEKIQQVIILDTCYSGSFMDELAGVENRIVITSTDDKSLAWQPAYSSFSDKLLNQL